MYKQTTFALLALSATALATAAEPELGELKQQIEVQAQQLRELKQSLEEQQRKSEQDRRSLEAQQTQIEELQRQIETQTADLNRRLPQPDRVLDLYAGRGTPNASQQQAQNQPQQTGGQTATPPKPQPSNAPPAAGAPGTGGPGTVGQAPDKPKDAKPPEVAPLFQQPGVLTPKARLVLEPSLQYDYSTNNRAAIAGFSVLPTIVVGLIDVRTVNRSTWTAALTGRYGLTNRLEVEARVPFVYRRDSTIARPFGEDENTLQTERAFTADGSKLGDVELTARYQLNQPAPDKAYYVGSVRFKTRTGESPFEVETFSPFAGSGLLQKELPTGSGFYGLQLGVSAIYPSDPVVFFGNLSYLHNFERNVGNGYGRIDPGDIFGFSFGMGLGLNEKASFSVGYEHSTIGKLEQDGVVPPATTSTQLGTLSLGYSYRSSTKRTWNWSLGIGVTKDTPDVTLRLRVPTTVTKN